MAAPLNDNAFRCLLCASGEPPYGVQDTVTGDLSGTLRAVQCLACSHVQLSPPSYDLDLYRKDGQVSFVVGQYGTSIQTVFDHSAIEAKRRAERFAECNEHFVREDAALVAAPVRLLDIGGGYGFFGSAMTSLMPDVDVHVLEPSANRALAGRAYFTERGDATLPPPNFEIGLVDEAFVAANHGRYDVVTMWHVLEHVDDPLALMASAGALLRANGTLWIEVPNVDDDLAILSPAYRIRSFMREHLSYFSKETLERMARRLFPDAGIEVIGYQRYGIFNYFHWIEHNAPQGASPDMFERDRWSLETMWRSLREATRTSDALLLIVRRKPELGDGR